MQPFVSALGNDLGLTSKEIADIIWLALQMQDSDETVATTTRREASRPAQTTSDRPRLDSTHRPDSTASDESSDRDAPTQSAELHLNQPNGNQAGFGQQLALNVPDARSLREPLSLARSLKPLLRRVVTGWSTELDETATVERIADEQLWLPVLKPALEPWLDLALVVDESDSMQIWQRTIAELQRLLSHYGVFRDVRVWGLVTDATGEVRLRPGIGAAGRRQAARRPSELIDPSGRRLILVATDCVAAGWQDGRLLPTLKLWATSGPLAIVQMLPEWLWSRTGLGFAAAVRLQALLPGVPNQQLVATDWSAWDEVDLEVGIKVPVVTLEPEPFGTWTAMVTGKGGAWSPGFVFEPSPSTGLGEGSREREEAEDSAEQRVQRFRVTASPMARRLAGLLAAAPVISLPVVRIIQDRLLAGSRQVHVAEVFLGGLLKPLGESGVEMNPDAVQYEFWDGVREGLLESLPTSDSVNVLQEVSQFVAERLGLSLNAFAAVLRNPQQAEDRELASQSRPFAMVTAQILQQLGGEYAGFAEELEQSHQPDLQLDLASTLNELDGEYVQFTEKLELSHQPDDLQLDLASTSNELDYTYRIDNSLFDPIKQIDSGKRVDQFKQDANLLYDHFIYFRQRVSPRELVERFYQLFIDGVGYPDSEIASARDRIIHWSDQEFLDILNRCCYILINYWWLKTDANPEIRAAITDLMNLFQTPPTNRSDALPIRHLHSLVQRFTTTPQYEILQRRARVAGYNSQYNQQTAADDVSTRTAEPISQLIDRYPLLYAHYLQIDEDISEVGQQAVKRLQIQREQQFEHDLLQYTTSLNLQKNNQPFSETLNLILLNNEELEASIQQFTIKLKTQREKQFEQNLLWYATNRNLQKNNQPFSDAPNPTRLTDDQLDASIRQFVGKSEGSHSYRDSAFDFLREAGQTISYKKLKSNLYDYLTQAIHYSANPKYGNHSFNHWLSDQLNNNQPHRDNLKPNGMMLVQTCGYLLNSLLNLSHSRNHVMFIDLISNLGSTFTMGLVLKLMLLCRSVPANLEAIKSHVAKCFAMMFRHYETRVRNEIEWLIECLDNLMIAFTIHFGETDFHRWSNVLV